MSDALAGLEPRSLWGHFASIARQPRPSKHEQRILAWVRSVAAEHGWPVDADAVGNLVLRVPATEGLGSAPTVILQAHLDMVCEKNADVEHDFMNDPIVPRVDDGWIYATGTTLGADNGIGVAAALAAATDPLVAHGPLELLFTIDEETGLTGAQQLDGSLLRGRILLNMDSEEDGKLFVGCAGGADNHLRLRPRRLPPTSGTRALRLEVRGLRGGHSGLNIHENRGNALKLVTRILAEAIDSGADLELAELRGGSKHNAIPREADAALHVGAAAEPVLRAAVSRMTEAFSVELAGIDDGLSVELVDGAGYDAVLAGDDRDRLLRLLAVLPHGVLAMSPDIPGLVETSSNVAAVGPDRDAILVVTSTRSSVAPSQAAVLGAIRAAGALAGADVEIHDGYPGWKPNMDSALLAVARGVYGELWGAPPEVTAVHAGLECGLLGEKVPGLDMISFGPQIEGAHSPDERVNVASVARFWDALVLVLARLAAA
jgi:dipeptidase D